MVGVLNVSRAGFEGLPAPVVEVVSFFEGVGVFFHELVLEYQSKSYRIQALYHSIYYRPYHCIININGRLEISRKA